MNSCSRRWGRLSFSSTFQTPQSQNSTKTNLGKLPQHEQLLVAVHCAGKSVAPFLTAANKRTLKLNSTANLSIVRWQTFLKLKKNNKNNNLQLHQAMSIRSE